MPFDLFCTAIWEKPELIAMSAFRSFFMCFVVAAAIVIPISAQLSPDFYDKLCPQALPTIRSILEKAIYHEPRLGASLLRVHFHDCFVNVSLVMGLFFYDCFVNVSLVLCGIYVFMVALAGL